MQAAHDTARIPLLMGYGLYRRMRARKTAMERDKQVNATDQDDPEQEKGQRAEVIQRVPLGTEGKIKPGLERKINAL